MPYNGLGVFTPSISYVADKNSAIGPQASRFDTNFNDVATGLSNVICRDGQSTVSQNISFGNKKITNLADATAVQDAMNLRSVQAAGALMFVAGAGSGTAITGSTSPTFASLVIGMLFMVTAPADSGAGCTFAVNGLTAHSILWPSAVAVGDFKTSDTLLLLWDGTNFRWLNKWRHSDVPVAAIVPFLLSSAPTGWTQVTAAGWNDRMMRVVTGAGAGSGGAWAISGLSNESANHTHTFSGTTGQTTDTLGMNGGSTQMARDFHTHPFSGTTAGVSASHTHTGDGSWRPAYADFIICQRDT